jgi:hypothetical protein
MRIVSWFASGATLGAGTAACANGVGSAAATNARDRMTNQVEVSSHMRRDRVLGAVGQVAGVIGIVACILLIIGVVMGRNWLIGTVSDVQDRIDVGLVRAETLVDNASTRVSEVSGRVGAVSDAAAAVAAKPNPAPALTEFLLTQLSGVSDRYLALRSSYTDVRETAVATLDRLNTLDRMLPFLSIPQGPVDALASLDQRFQQLDASIMQVLSIPGAGAVDAVATAVAAKADAIQTSLNDLTAKMADGKARLESLRGRIADKADQFSSIVTIATVVMILFLVYFVFLHWLLFHTGRTLWRGAMVTAQVELSATVEPPAAVVDEPPASATAPKDGASGTPPQES